MDEKEKAYIRDVLLMLKRVVAKMPDEMPETEECWEFDLQIHFAESQILKLKRELGHKD